jgi:putative FmdB family regulatory protein
MPLYDLECNKCKNLFTAFYKVTEVEKAKCPICGSQARVIILQSPNKDWFREGWYDDLDLNPVYVRSKSHMKELCRTHNVIYKAIGDVRNITEI